MKTILITATLPTGLSLEINAPVQVGLHQPKEVLQAQLAVYLRGQMVSFINYTRTRLRIIKAIAEFQQKLIKLEMMLPAPGSPLRTLCSYYAHHSTTIKELLPHQGSAHYKTWTVKFNHLINWCCEYKKTTNQHD